MPPNAKPGAAPSTSSKVVELGAEDDEQDIDIGQWASPLNRSRSSRSANSGGSEHGGGRVSDQPRVVVKTEWPHRGVSVLSWDGDEVSSPGEKKHELFQENAAGLRHKSSGIAVDIADAQSDRTDRVDDEARPSAVCAANGEQVKDGVVDGDDNDDDDGGDLDFEFASLRKTDQAPPLTPGSSNHRRRRKKKLTTGALANQTAGVGSAEAAGGGAAGVAGDSSQSAGTNQLRRDTSKAGVDLLSVAPRDGNGEVPSPSSSSKASRDAVRSSSSSSSSAAAAQRPLVAFKEAWAEKEARYRSLSAVGHLPGWRLVPVIVKSGDDLRQEQCAAQLIHQMDQILRAARCSYWLRPYDIIALSPDSGLIEAVADTISLDALRKSDKQYKSLLEFFEHFFGPKESLACARARRNFVMSLASYCIVCYILSLKDRHNGNILLDREGHIIHIDFGFVLGKERLYDFGVLRMCGCGSEGCGCTNQLPFHLHLCRIHCGQVFHRGATSGSKKRLLS